MRNVDAKLRFEMRLELPRLLRQSGSAVLYVTQDYKEAMAIADKIAVLQGGGFEQVATPEEIYLEPASLSVARLFGDPAINVAESRVETDGNGAAVTLAGRRMTIDPGYRGYEGARSRSA